MENSALPPPLPIPSAPPQDEGTPEVMRPPLSTTGPAEAQPHTANASASLKDVFSALSQQGYTRGLAEALIENSKTFPLRIWIVDNSGSMASRDGHRFVETSGTKRTVKRAECTRWVEMQETVGYHAQMSALLKSQTVFRLLNDPGRACGPQQFSIGQRDHSLMEEDVRVAQDTIKATQPAGVTPLSRHIQEIRDIITGMQSTLLKNGQKVAVVIATDGVPTNPTGSATDATNQEFVTAMKALEGLPVWIVIRLCTDQDEVVEYYDRLDQNLEMSLEVLDDYVSEAKEIHQHNRWLNYGLPLHRMREWGFYHRLFDLLDERPFTTDEIRDFCRLLCGMDAAVPDPEVDWKAFLKCITKLLHSEEKQWNPITHKMEPWIDVSRLEHDYGPPSSCVVS